ncbi:MAG TPA: phosphatase PAP2 family protein [Actinomycetes bacterium]|nr:phosphatase PAP2 family protein [Actinomycetes bacterium]
MAGVAALGLGPVTSLVVLGAVLAAVAAALVALVGGRTRHGHGPGEHVAEELARVRLGRFLRRRLDPEAATGLALTVSLGLIFLAALGFGLVSDMVTSRTGLYRWDAAAADWGARNATPTSTRVLGWLTWLGGTAVVLPLALLLGALEWLRRRRAAVLGFLLLVVVGQNLISNGVKLLVQRERPPVPHLADSSGFSFPSGHSAAAAATYAAVALVLGRGRPWRVKAMLAAGAAAVTVAVAASRVLLGVHWLTDVVGGVVLGFGWFVVCAIAFGGALLHFAAPAERVEAEEAREAAGEAREAAGEGRGAAGEGRPPGQGRLAAMSPDPEPTDEQVRQRAETLAAEPGNPGDDREAQARALLEESEERVEDPAAREPDHRGVIRRGSDEGIGRG